MKVLQINCVYNTGSTGKIVHDIHVILKEKGVESVVCYGRGKTVNEPGITRVSSEFTAKFNNLLSRFTGLQFAGCASGTRQVIRVIKREKPDVVHLQCINGFFVNIYKLVNFLKKNHIPTVLTSHAEFFYTGNCAYAYECNKWQNGCGNCPRVKSAAHSYIFDRTAKAWKKMKNAFDGFEEFESVSVSEYIQHRAEASPILSNHKNITVKNGIETKIFTAKNVECLKEKHGITDEKIIFHVTASLDNPRKGGKYILDLAERFKGENVKIIVAGRASDSQNWPENMIYAGSIADQNLLADYYSLADVTVIPSKGETFSMPVAESLCCGTPVVGFLAGGPESITIKEYSEFVEYGNSKLLFDTVKRWLGKKTEMPNISKEAKACYSKECMAEEYFRVYTELDEKYRKNNMIRNGK